MSIILLLFLRANGKAKYVVNGRFFFSFSGAPVKLKDKKNFFSVEIKACLAFYGSKKTGVALSWLPNICKIRIIGSWLD